MDDSELKDLADKVKIPTLHVRITADDMNDRGLVKGEVVWKIFQTSKQPLARIMDALNAHELQFSMKEFVKCAADSGQYGEWSLKKMIVAAMKLVYPTLMGTNKWQLMHAQLKKEIKQVFEDRKSGLQ